MQIPLPCQDPSENSIYFFILIWFFAECKKEKIFHIRKVLWKNEFFFVCRRSFFINFSLWSGGNGVLFLYLKEKGRKRSKPACRWTACAPSIVPSDLFLIPRVQIPGSSDYRYTRNQEVRKCRFSESVVSIWWRGAYGSRFTRTTEYRTTRVRRFHDSWEVPSVWEQVVPPQI